MFDPPTLLLRVLRPRHRRLELAPSARVETHRRIVERMFEVDISDIDDGNLAEVAEHIAANSPRL